MLFLIEYPISFYVYNKLCSIRLGSNTIISFFIYAILHITLHWSLTNFNAKIASKEFETKKTKMKLVKKAMH